MYASISAGAAAVMLRTNGAAAGPASLSEVSSNFRAAAGRLAEALLEHPPVFVHPGDLRGGHLGARFGDQHEIDGEETRGLMVRRVARAEGVDHLLDYDVASRP